MGGEACGLGEGTHYGCECVMRRLAEAEARAAGLESALAVAGEENAALTESRDAALRALASEQARRETAEAEVERWKQTALTIQTNLAESHREECRRQWLRGHTEAFEDAATAYDEKLAAAETSLSAALRRAEELEKALRGLRAAVSGVVFNHDAGGRTWVVSPRATLFAVTHAMCESDDLLRFSRTGGER
jgi:chromosome segregation ATPase